jgi:hypothetical protein
MRLDTNGRSLLPHISRDQLVDKLATKYEEYSYPCLEVERVKTDGTYLFYGLEQWITKLNCEIKRNPRKLRDVNELLTAGWIEGDPIINSTVHVLHINNTKEVVQKVYRKLLGEWEAKGLRCLNTLRCKTDKEKYEDKKQDPTFLYNKARKEVLRKIKKTGKMPNFNPQYTHPHQKWLELHTRAVAILLFYEVSLPSLSALESRPGAL